MAPGGLASAQTEQETISSITRLPASVGMAKRLLALVREHWGLSMESMLAMIAVRPRMPLHGVGDMPLTS